jgi:S-adenosylmethionine decarboxylase
LLQDPTCKFEGPEKKLEIILFSPSPELRHNHDGRWERVVQASRAEVISSIFTEHLDAYLLSESSLFVWEDRVLMITCGKTTLIDAVPEILKIIDRNLIAFVFYERKSFMFPHEQPSDFEDDVARLVDFFPGKSYRLGPANDDHVHVFYASNTHDMPKRDVTLQVLMHDLEPGVIKIFTSEIDCDAGEVEKRSGLNRIYTGMKKDSYLFSPYGYSLNAIFEKNYITIHVTPQPEGSYVSFETNVIQENYDALARQVISIFRPGRFSLVLTTSMDPTCRPLRHTVGRDFFGYDISEKSVYEFNSGYAVTFMNYISNYGPD